MFKQPDAPAQDPVKKRDTSKEDGEAKSKRSREEWEREKMAREKRKQESRKFKSLYGRKTKKGQPVMKYRINHLLSKIKSGVGRN